MQGPPDLGVAQPLNIIVQPRKKNARRTIGVNRLLLVMGSKLFRIEAIVSRVFTIAFTAPLTIRENWFPGRELWRGWSELHR